MQLASRERFGRANVEPFEPERTERCHGDAALASFELGDQGWAQVALLCHIGDGAHMSKDALAIADVSVG
eukprot:7380864-Prymnesium_polylepis.2